MLMWTRIGSIMEETGAGESLTPTEREELERLRRQVSEGHGPRPVLRWTAAGMALVLVVALGICSVLARNVRNVVLDTDRYLDTVAPLSSDPILQGELTDRITDLVVTRLGVENIAADALKSITDNAPRVPRVVVGLAPLLAEEARSFVHDTVESLLSSDQFGALWIHANREAHEALVAMLTGKTSAAVAIDAEGTVSISLRPIIDTVRDKLIARGFAFAERIPEIDKSFVLIESPSLAKAQRAVSALDKLAAALPWLTLLAAAIAVGVTPRGSRLRSFSLVGVSLAVAMALLAVAISIGRSLYLGAVDADVLAPDSAAVLIDSLLQPMRTTLRAVFALGVVIALSGYLAGSSATANLLRRSYRREPSAAGSFAAKFRIPLRAAIIATAVATLVLWKYPSAVVVICIALVALAAIAAVELVARPAVALRSDEFG